MKLSVGSLFILSTTILLILKQTFGESSPLVLFPSSLHPGGTNNIYVTPLLHNLPNVDISLTIREYNEQRTKVFEHILLRQNSKATAKFSVQLSPRNFTTLKYYVEVQVSGHDAFFTTLSSAVNLRLINLQTDKLFYRPTDTVEVRALPLTQEGSLYQGDIHFQLLDPNGFKIFNKTSLADNRFIATSFKLPRFLRFGDWKVVASAPNSLMKFDSLIKVNEYTLPKYRVFLNVEKTSDSPFIVKVTVFARFSHGLVVNGDLILRCSLIAKRDSDKSADAPFNSPAKKLLSAELHSGVWQGKVDLSSCVPSQESPPPKFQLIAEISERGTLLAGTGILEYDAFAAGFELVPLRPAFTENTPKILIYLRLLSSLLSAGEDSVEVISQCISNDKAVNGLNQSIVGQKLGTIVEVNIDLMSRCEVYVIRARRKLSSSHYSREETIVLPSMFGTNFFDFSFIQPVSPAKVDFAEGDVIEVNVPPDINLNYFMSCNSKSIVAANSVSSNGRIMIPVTSKMSGACVLYVYTSKQKNFRSDMYLFFVPASICPRDYSIKLSSKNITVFTSLDVYLQAKPHSWALLHAYDSRLEGLLKAKTNFLRSKHWIFSEFLKPDDKSDLVWFSNMLKISELTQILKTTCSKAGKHTPQCPANAQRTTSSHLSDVCFREFKSACDSPTKGKVNQNNANLVDQRQLQLPQVHIATVPFLMQAPAPKSPKNLRPDNTVESDVMEDVQMDTQNPDDLLIREYFPEVWLFSDYKIGDSGSLTIPLKSPHSVTEWRFSAGFWSEGRASMCQAPSRSVVSLKHVFLDVDLPSNVYENETIQVRVTVTANVAEETNMAVCFRGLSPVVCGDVGKDGTLGETDYTRVVVSKAEPFQIKAFYVRFLRQGIHNLSFELREENNLPGGDWHCRDDETRIFDRITKLVTVEQRVNLEEHYRQIIVYRLKRIATQQLLSPSPMMLVSAPDVISFSQSNMDEDTVLTQIHVTSQERMYNLDMELSKFIPSFPPSLSSDLLPSNAQLRNNRNKRRRVQRGADNNNNLIGSSYSLSNVLKELAALVYELKTLKTMIHLIPAAEIEERETNLSNLLSELLTFSDCSSKHLECGFGEFGRPETYDDRNILLTTIATSLLCEQSVAEEYICGPLTFLAYVATRLYRSENIDLGYSTHLHFEEEADKILFLQALLVSTVMDCGMYSCTNATESWKKLHQDFYKFDESKEYDLRTESALAYVSTPFTRIILRRRIANKARVDRLPYWNVESKLKVMNKLDSTLLKSGNVLANSLALLAYTSNTSVYQIWRTEFNFDDLTNWLVEQQTANRQFENAIDTYFGARSLYSYHLTQMPRGLYASITGNISSADLSAVRQFDAKELPFSLSMAPFTTSVYLSSRGEGRLLLGVRAITERRRRSKRDPTDIYPVTIRLSQSRNPGNLSHILQTVTIVLHSSMIKHLEIQHGLFTGFTTYVSNVELLAGSSHLERPTVSSTAVHFLLKNMKKEEPVTYAVTVIEPSFNYSPENLAPIAISAICHSVMGRLIVLPSSLSFAASNTADSQEEANSVAQHPRNRRQNIHIGRRRLARTFVSSAQEAYRLDGGQRIRQGNGRSVASNLQTISAELVETVCLPNGACICAESTCASLRCSNCSSLSFNFLCEELRQPMRFAIIFRITGSRSAKQGEAEYSVFDIKILDWYGDVLNKPDQLTIWLRNCNLQCISMTSSTDNTSSKPRFLLVGDAQGLFDGSSADLESDTSPAHPFGAVGLTRTMSSMAQMTTQTTVKTMMRTQYVLRDSDRLARSTDCWPLFGRLQDEQC